MNRMYQFLILLVSAIVLSSCQPEMEDLPSFRTANEISIIPKVNDLQVSDSFFSINNKTEILVLNDSTQGGEFLQEVINYSSNFKVPIVKLKNEEFNHQQNFIFIDNTRKFINNEGYEIVIDSVSIYISAMNNKGVLHAIQTLRQLFVDDFYSGKKRSEWHLPCLKISDAPRFKHRGLLLDCSRHFFKKEIVKKYISLLSLYKMNVLHWHLTEDQGWRIEIDAYPKLTEIGAWRTELDGTRYGGFYSKSDIQEIVTYATDHGVTIIPEIELPGHSQAAIAAYPYLSCTGEKVNVANDWGVFKEIYCAGNDSVFQFIETVLDEVLELFPSEYIHIGGDEAPKFRWEHCRKCQKRMTENGLKDEHELQSYFINRVEKYLNSKNRKLIGWDEILEGGLSANATVQSWRGMEGGIIASKSKHKAIMSPTSHAYFDYDLKSIDLEKVYNFMPIPEGLTTEESDYIIGGECNIWTEHVPNDSVLDSKVFPRMLAMSEVLWSGYQNKKYDEFYNRVQGQYPLLKAFGVKYGAETISVALDIVLEDEKIGISAIAGHSSLEVRYRWNCDTCKVFLPYLKPIQTLQSGELEFQTYKSGKLYGGSVKQKIENHKALGEMITYKYLYSRWYESDKELALVDSRLGSSDFKDGCWQGFWGDDIEVVIDLGRIEKINHLETHFFQYSNSWIFMPTEIVFEGSTGGLDFYELGRLKPKTEPTTRGKNIENFILKVNNLEMQYIRLTAKNIEKVPSWHEAAGSEAWLFIDEIVVR